MPEGTTEQSDPPTTATTLDPTPPDDTSTVNSKSTPLATKDLPHTLDEKKDDAPAVVRRKDPRIFKIIVIGDSNCGKTCLTYRFCEGRFPNQVEATIGVDFREKFIELEGESLKLQLWDTAGQERFRRSMVPHYYRNVHAVVYVYDVTKRSSFDGLATWLHEFQQFAPVGLDVPRIVIGNKVDLENLREVSVSEGQNFADRFSMPHFETSAKDESKTDHTEAIFMTLAHKLKASKPMMGERYSSSSSYDPLANRSIKYTAIGQDNRSTCC